MPPHNDSITEPDGMAHALPCRLASCGVFLLDYSMGCLWLGLRLPTCTVSLYVIDATWVRRLLGAAPEGGQ